VIARLSPRDRRTLVVGAAVVAALVLLARGLPAWRRWDADARASAAEMAGEAERAERGARQLPAALDSLQARRTRFVALGSAALDGGSPAAAGASLAGLVSSAAMRAGVRMGSVQVRTDSVGAGTFVRVGVRADGTGDLPAITRMLQLLEGAPERLAIREIAITQPNPGGPAEQPEALRLELAIDGLALVGPRPAGLPAAAEEADDADPAWGDDPAGPAGEPGSVRPAAPPPGTDETYIPEPSP
jgi:hypothetical protein